MQLKLIVVLVLFSATFFTTTFTACSGKGDAPFCDTTCFNDSIKFSKEEHPLQPYVYISSKNCEADTVTLSYRGMGVNRKFDFGYKLNKNYVRCFIKDTSYVWLVFNTCENGRGYFWKLPFSKAGRINKATSAINNFDPRFAVADGLVAYTDKGNIFIEDMETGKKAMMTFGKQADFDLDAIHETLDSVNITRNRVWVKVKLDEEWKELEKSITLQ